MIFQKWKVLIFIYFQEDLRRKAKETLAKSLSTPTSKTVQQQNYQELTMLQSAGYVCRLSILADFRKTSFANEFISEIGKPAEIIIADMRCYPKSRKYWRNS